MYNFTPNRLVLYVNDKDTIMSFLYDVQNGLLFSQKSNASLNRASINFSDSLSQIARPYYDLTSNVNAIGHPFFHAAQLLRDVGHFVYGTLVLVGALVTGHLNAAGKRCRLRNFKYCSFDCFFGDSFCSIHIEFWICFNQCPR